MRPVAVKSLWLNHIKSCSWLNWMSLLASRAIGDYQTLAIQGRRLAKIFLRTTKGEADDRAAGPPGRRPDIPALQCRRIGAVRECFQRDPRDMGRLDTLIHSIAWGRPTILLRFLS